MKKLVPVPIIFLLFLFTSIAFAHYDHFEIPTATITIDGNSDDWNNIEPVYVDDVNDEDPDANYEGTDLHKLYLAKDDTFLYLMMTLYDGAPKEEDSTTDLTTYYSVGFMQDPVSDLLMSGRVVSANHSGGNWHSTVGKVVDVNDWSTIANYPSRYVGAGSNFIEWRVYLSDMATLNGRYIWVFIHPHVPEESDKYPLSDNDNTYIHIVDDDATSATPTPTTSTPTPSPTPAAGTGAIYGNVVDEEWSSFRGVSVSLTGANGYSQSTKTDADGYYEFKNLAAGDYTLTCEKDGYQAKTQETSLGEGEIVDLGTIVMEPIERGSISGYVVDITGEPIESAKLKLKGLKTGTLKIEVTDADGFFEFTDLDADNYFITVKKKRYRSARKSVTIEEGEAKEIEIEMRKTTKRRSISLLMKGKQKGIYSINIFT